MPETPLRVSTFRMTTIDGQTVYIAIGGFVVTESTATSPSLTRSIGAIAPGAWLRVIVADDDA